MVRGLIADAINIVENLYIPDLLAVASFYPEWTKIGGGLGNYMVYGDLPQNGIGDVAQFRFPRGVILNKNLSEVLPVDPADPARCRRRSRTPGIEYPDGKDVAASLGRRHRGPSTPGPKPPYKQLDENEGVLLAESAALERASDGSGTAGAHAGGVRQRAQRVQRSGDRRARAG